MRQIKKHCLLFYANGSTGGQLYLFWTYDTSPSSPMRNCVMDLMMRGGVPWTSNDARLQQSFDYNRRWWHAGDNTPHDRKGSWI